MTRTNISDANTDSSEINQLLEYDTIGFPPPEALPNNDHEMPFFVPSDDAFELRKKRDIPFKRRNWSPTTGFRDGNSGRKCLVFLSFFHQ